MTDYTDVDGREPVIRLLHTIAIHELERTGRGHLIPALLDGGGRVEEIPDVGLAVFIGDELVVRVTDAAIRLGLQLEEIDHAAAVN